MGPVALNAAPWSPAGGYARGSRAPDTREYWHHDDAALPWSPRARPAGKGERRVPLRDGLQRMPVDRARLSREGDGAWCWWSTSPTGLRRVSEDLWPNDSARRLMVWGRFDRQLVAVLPAKELRAQVRRKGMAAHSREFSGRSSAVTSRASSPRRGRPVPVRGNPPARASGAMLGRTRS